MSRGRKTNISRPSSRMTEPELGGFVSAKGHTGNLQQLAVRYHLSDVIIRNRALQGRSNGRSRQHNPMSSHQSQTI